MRCGVWLVVTVALGVMGADAAAADKTRYERVEPSEKDMRRLQALTPEDFARTVDIEDDDLETVAVITTLPGYKPKGRFTDPVKADNFLRAMIDKRSGAIRYQLYESVLYLWQWRHFRSATYASPEGPKDVELKIINTSVDCSMGGCVYNEEVGIPMTEDQLEQIASTYAPGSSPMWRFRLQAKSGMDWQDQLAPAEAAGLLIAVNKWRADHGMEE